MTVDTPIDSPNGNVIVIDDSFTGTDEEENRLNLKTSNATKLPVVILKKLENNDQYYVVSPRSSSRPRKLKNFEGFSMELSPKKRLKSVKTDDDFEMLSPSKIQKRQIKSQGRNEDNVDSLCTSMRNSVQLTTPMKRSLNKSDYYDDELTDNASSPRKRGTQESTPVKSTPKKGKPKKKYNFSSMKTDENEPVVSGKRHLQTPKSVKMNLDESFRTSVLKSTLNFENVKTESRGRTEGGIHESPRKLSTTNSPNKSRMHTRRTTRKSYALYYYSDSDDSGKKSPRKQSEKVYSAKRRILRSRNTSTSSDVANFSSENETESDEYISPKYRRKTLLKSGSDLDCSDIQQEDEPYRSVQPKTPSRRNQVLRPRKDSTTPNASDKSEKSPARKPPREVAKTPKTPRNRKPAAVTPRSVRATPKTPKNRLKLLRDGVITPSMHSRSSIIPGDSTPLMKARSQLHVSYVPTSLPCREKEYLDVYNFLRGKLDDGCGGCIYISGVPGTGKTATVTSVIDNLLNDKKVPKFSNVSVNGMRLTEPRQSYVEIWKQLTGKTVPWEQAQSLLEERFTKKKNTSPVVMLIDELDILCTKRQDVVYNLLDWPTKSKDQLIVITIANTMDLPERLLMSRVTSRLGLTRLTFQAYTHKQLMEIVTKRLTGTDSFNSDAIQLVARKVASVSGDARRALDICRRAAEIAEQGGEGQLVNIMHINEALNAMITQPQVTAIKRCSRLQKLLLQAIVAEIERTGVEETTFSDVFRILVSCCALDGFKMVSSTAAQRAICELSAYRLIITDQKCSNIYQRIILNVSVHDVYFALKKE